MTAVVPRPNQARVAVAAQNVPIDTNTLAGKIQFAAHKALSGVWAATISGTLHGLVELPFVVPIEASITQQQLNNKGFFWNFRDLANQKKLYFSLNTTAVGLIPKCVLHYAWMNFWTTMVCKSGSLRQSTFREQALVGLMTGGSEVVFLTPFNYVKFRMQRPEYGYTSMWNCITRTIAEKGPWAFWNGTQAIFFRNSICMFGMLGLQQPVKNALPEKWNNTLRTFTGGVLCGVIGAFMSYPFEMLRAARQHDVSFKEEMLSKGFKRMFAGFAPGAFRLTFHSAVLGFIIPEMDRFAKSLDKTGAMIGRALKGGGAQQQSAQKA
uniref:Mitochondrial carrier protein n=1 Tax=Chromera velia CCMP2878 TaxID=1169474 RepID=A0A0G4HEE9_9ALVE|eukprot:Cvel_6482.t1-p1 / transcript=Cvel_6482.t1 / gene=Cvel_6482 / organism=Chromera_velia_CCMP2878 / gene_product=Probable mitochondrial 2-oxodicarboxylate carrier, putative / transcript_product=Probable mitochondrial 2-oxodicarboxylate carrier, putative / location=Cvel_scaffold318:19334-20573(+) / protein_length=322 / sequence_SO=supercontig / SO=protein_coding / is_pseudo=false